MKVTIEITPTEFLFAKHLGEQVNMGGVEDYLHSLLDHEMQAHPDYRTCSNPRCLDDIIPLMTISPRKHVQNENACYAVQTAPCTACPQCGADTVTHEEGLKLDESDPEVINRYEALTEPTTPRVLTR